MSHKMRIVSSGETPACDKYLHRMLRQDNTFSTTKRSPAPRTYQEKISNLSKPATAPQRPKPRSNVRHQSPVQKVATQLIATLQKDNENVARNKVQPENSRHRHRSASEGRSLSAEREVWGQLLFMNKSKEKVSNFSNFDPLRTLHFLSKELHNRLQSVLPGEDDVLQMVEDIKHALKRIPPEVSTLLHNPSLVFSKPNLTTKNASCQTPPTLYQEDTEKFQKIMEENTFRLEASCKQLEIVCTNLQSEKEITERELDEARENVELLCKKVKELENEMETISNMKIRQLEEEKQRLQYELEKAIQEINDNPTMTHLRRLVDELKKQKSSSDETCAKLEYDMMLIKMEKEKFATLLTVRDREIKEIQDEMGKIQDQLNSQLKKLNGEVVKRSNSMKSLDPFGGLPENFFLEIGDTTLSSLGTSESDRDIMNIIKECPYGDAEIRAVSKEPQGELPEKIPQQKVNDGGLKATDDQRDKVFEELLRGLSPSCKALIKAQSLD